MEVVFQIMPPEFKPVSRPSDLSHFPLTPTSQQVSPHINVVAPKEQYTQHRSFNEQSDPTCLAYFAHVPVQECGAAREFPRCG